MFEDSTKELTGLIANKLMSTYQQPVLLLHRTMDNGNIYWSGSGRNGSNNGLDDFRGFLQESNLIALAEGHENAFGFSISDENYDALMAYANDKLADYNFSPRYKIDLVFKANTIDTYDIVDIAQYNNLWGEGLEQPIILIKDIKLNNNMIEKRGTDTMIIKLNGMEMVKFKTSDEEFKKLEVANGITKSIDVIGTCSINDYNSMPQVIINDYEIVNTGYYF